MVYSKEMTLTLLGPERSQDKVRCEDLNWMSPYENANTKGKWRRGMGIFNPKRGEGGKTECPELITAYERVPKTQG